MGVFQPGGILSPGSIVLGRTTAHGDDPVDQYRTSDRNSAIGWQYLL